MIHAILVDDAFLEREDILQALRQALRRAEEGEVVRCAVRRTWKGL